MNEHYQAMLRAYERWVSKRPAIPEWVDRWGLENPRYKEMLLSRQAAWVEYVEARERFEKAYFSGFGSMSPAQYPQVSR